MSAVRFLCRVLVAIVALYAANDGLLQPYLHDAGDVAFRAIPKRAAMPVIVAAGSEDDREILPVVDGPLAPAPDAPLLPLPTGERRTSPLPAHPPYVPAATTRPGARAPPFPLAITA